jgi:hypothetical protein
MADAFDPNASPKPRGRRPAASSQTATGKPVAAKAAAAKEKVVKAASATMDSKTARKARAVVDEQLGKSADHARDAINSASAAVRATVKSAKESVSSYDWKAQGEQVREQASKLARDAAGSAKVKTGTAMHSLAQLINDTAQTVDTKLGPQYGDYTRQAANAVAGAARTLDEKDIDQLLGEARDFVRKSPAVAIGAAAVAGYVLMRLAKGSSPAKDEESDKA